MRRPLKRKLTSFITLLIAAIAAIFYLTKEYDHLFDFTPDSLPAEGSCSVYFIDVGQGDCSLISCNGVNFLIDAGENNRGDDVLLKLRELNIDTLDYVIGTHAHSDHIGGLDTVINGVTVKNIILSDLPDKLVPTTKTYNDLLNAIVENEVNLIPAEAGDSFDIGSGKLTILSPLTDEYSNLNNWSIITRFVFGETSFLFTGDAETAVEKDLIENGSNVSATLLKVSHHGSNTSSSKDFLKEVAPDYAVIEVGEGNSYGHPHSEILTSLEAIGAEVYRTDINGDITAVSDGKTITVSCENEG